MCAGSPDSTTGVLEIEATQRDLAVIDLKFDGASGLELLKGVRARYPKVRLLALSMNDECDYAERCLRAGALGYIMKPETPD